MLQFEISPDDRLALLGCVLAIGVTLVVLHLSEFFGAWLYGGATEITAEPGLFHTSHCSDEAPESGVSPLNQPNHSFERAA